MPTRLRVASTPVTRPSSTRTLGKRPTIARIGVAISAGDSPAIATWYSSG